MLRPDPGTAPQLLRAAREDAQLTQRELARRSGVQQSHIAAIESGTRTVSPELLVRLLRAADYRPSVPLEREARRIRNIAAERGIGNVRVFGSALHGTDRFDSDLDLLVDVPPGAAPFALATFVSHVQDLLGFPVDVVVDRAGGFADRIRAEAVPL
ncbi:MAG: XRE family transcriptional regulator [Microbacteriaceae bacterium]|nr:MAG: XRE family transcriptional regulator [Microbacteriaceae bacterium]